VSLLDSLTDADREAVGRDVAHLLAADPARPLAPTFGALFELVDPTRPDDEEAVFEAWLDLPPEARDGARELDDSCALFRLLRELHRQACWRTFNALVRDEAAWELENLLDLEGELLVTTGKLDLSPQRSVS
jgi:hypothetical protein